MNKKLLVDFDDTKTAFSSKTTKQLKKANLLFSIVNRKWLADIFTTLVKIGFAIKLPINWIIKRTIFEHFCGGESIDESRKTMQDLQNYNIKSILDYSIEGSNDEAGFDHAAEETLKTMELAKSSEWMPFSVFKPTGMGKAELFAKIHNNESLTDREGEEFKNIKGRINKICKFGFENDVPVLIDAEETWLQKPIDDIVYEMMASYNQAKAIVYNTYQMYCTHSLQSLKEAFYNAEKGNYYLGAKLVRGAYMEMERERAAEMGYEDPIHLDKKATDRSFDEGLAFCIENKQRIFLFCGSHNEISNYYLTELMADAGLNHNDPRIYFGQLFGMSDHISYNLAAENYNVAKYVPYGPIKQVMPYLFRRAEENTSARGQSSRELTLLKRELKRRRNSG